MPTFILGKLVSKCKLTPKYAKIKVTNTSPSNKYTQHKVPNIRIKDEFTYLHTKKQQSNQQIYHLHLTLDNSLNNTWPYIQHTIEEKWGGIQLIYKGDCGSAVVNVLCYKSAGRWFDPSCCHRNFSLT